MQFGTELCKFKYLEGHTKVTGRKIAANCFTDC